jgi:hypothetical protein
MLLVEAICTPVGPPTRSIDHETRPRHKKLVPQATATGRETEFCDGADVTELEAGSYTRPSSISAPAQSPRTPRTRRQRRAVAPH